MSFTAKSNNCNNCRLCSTFKSFITLKCVFVRLNCQSCPSPRPGLDSQPECFDSPRLYLDSFYKLWKAKKKKKMSWMQYLKRRCFWCYGWLNGILKFVWLDIWLFGGWDDGSLKQWHCQSTSLLISFCTTATSSNRIASRLVICRHINPIWSLVNTSLVYIKHVLMFYVHKPATSRHVKMVGVSIFSLCCSLAVSDTAWELQCDSVFTYLQLIMFVW